MGEVGNKSETTSASDWQLFQDGVRTVVIGKIRNHDDIDVRSLLAI